MHVQIWVGKLGIYIVLYIIIYIYLAGIKFGDFGQIAVFSKFGEF